MKGPGRLTELAAAGRLAAEYPRVRALLLGASDAELARAGRLLARLDPDEVARTHPGVPACTVAITGHGTVAGLVPALTAELARHGILTRPHLAPFGTYVSELLDPASALYAAEPDLTLCVLDAGVVFDEVPPSWRPGDVERAAREKAALLRKLAVAFTSAGRGTLVLNTVPLEHGHAAQLVDHRSRARLGIVWREFNTALLELAAEHPDVVVLDLDPLVGAAGAVEDPRPSVYAKAHLNAEVLAAYAREAGHLARHLAGRTRKCLVLDLDGTLWGGTLGDDGPEGVTVGEGLRGEAFASFQRVVGQLASQGILLAVVSKNDADLVRTAFREHPGMVLREEDFVRIVANWGPKPDNLVELAADLGLGVECLVFVDDSPYERDLVAHRLPEVAVVAVDEEPAWHAPRLLRDGWFDVVELTREDAARPARYRAELDRRDFSAGFDSLADYLRELDVSVDVAPARERDIPRVSQITLRTNQFNLTTRRLSQGEVAAMATDPDTSVLTVRAADRFGDNGTVGAVFLRRRGDELHIDNFLLSCRVFARGIEQACMSAVLLHARATGASAVVGTYVPTPRNAGARDFYPRQGFRRDGGADGPDGARTFRHDLRHIAPAPGHIRLTAGFAASEGTQQ
ncbi:HAD-IIIC family phosphatase [Actinomadura sp. NPDC000600]|uniref:HAD-IIIC family phosphatase n=1 Tax=Actinomadura sp. NPDC000600 TaxID=3154262 RepID=UPI00339290D0